MATVADTKIRWQEIANRGLEDRFDPEERVKFDEAVRRGLIVKQQPQQPQQAQSTQPRTTGSRSGDVALSGVKGLNRAIPALLGAPIDLSTELVNLGIAGAGTIQALLNKVAPDLVSDRLPETLDPRAQLGGSASFERGISQLAGDLGLSNREDLFSPIDPNDPLQRGANIAGTVLGGGVVSRRAPLQTLKDLVPAAAGAGIAGAAFPETPLAPLAGALIPGGVRAAIPQRKAKPTPKQQQQAETDAEIKAGRETVEALERETGKKVGLFKAQQTQLPADLIKQRLLPQLEPGAKKSATALENQNKEVFDLTMSLVDKISPSKATTTGSQRFRKASQLAIESRRQRRTASVSPLFEEAFKKGADVDLRPVNNVINKALREVPESSRIFRDLTRAANLVTGGRAGNPSLRQLQKAKFEMDDMLEGVGGSALGNFTKREIIGIKSALTEQMGKASPLYAKANKKFERLSPAVESLENSILGVVSKIKDPQLKGVSKRIFDAGNSNVRDVVNAKKIIEDIDPGAWNDLLRVEFERRVGGLTSVIDDLPSELARNIPGQLKRAIFGNPSQRKILLAGMNKEQRKNFTHLEEILRRAESGRQAGSPTVPFGEALKSIKGIWPALRAFLKDPKEKLLATGEQAATDKRIATLTDTYFNPKWEDDLAKLRKLNPSSQKAGDLYKALLQKVTTQIVLLPQTQRSDSETKR